MCRPGRESALLSGKPGGCTGFPVTADPVPQRGPPWARRPPFPSSSCAAGRPRWLGHHGKAETEEAPSLRANGALGADPAALCSVGRAEVLGGSRTARELVRNAGPCSPSRTCRPRGLCPAARVGSSAQAGVAGAPTVTSLRVLPAGPASPTRGWTPDTQETGSWWLHAS